MAVYSWLAGKREGVSLRLVSLPPPLSLSLSLFNEEDRPILTVN